MLDRSGSMTGVPLANLKLGANTFIDIIDEATDSSQDGNIGSGSHIGIVSFADTATADTQLITSVAALKAAVDGRSAFPGCGGGKSGRRRHLLHRADRIRRDRCQRSE